MKYRTIKQLAGSLNCTACVAAMVTGHSVEDVHEWLGNEVGMPMWDDQLIAWLLKNGWQMLHGLSWSDGLESPSVGLQIAWNGLLGERPAILGVASKTYPGEKHTVFWDGRVLRDPHPDVPEEVDSLEGYTVFECFPLWWSGQSNVKTLRLERTDEDDIRERRVLQKLKLQDVSA